MSQKIVSVLILVVVVVWLLVQSIVPVNATEEAVVVRSGQVTSTLSPGLHLLVPVVDRAVSVDTRSQVTTLPAIEVDTASGQPLGVNFYVLWQISDVATYAHSTLFSASSQNPGTGVDQWLEKQLKAPLKKQLSQLSQAALLSGGQQDALAEIVEGVNQKAAKMGIQISQLQLQNISWPKAARQQVYQLMQADAVAEQKTLKAENAAKVAQVEAATKAKVATLLADAHRKAQQLRAAGDAKAGAIYAKAYGQAPEFYRFYRSMQAYRNSFDGQGDVLVLGPDNDFLHYFRHMDK